MRLLATLALLLAVRTVAAQTASDDRRAVARPCTFDNEIGLRFGAQIGLGRDDGPELQALNLDYARYGWRNIGLRTGVNLFLNGDVENYLSVPLHFSWRSGRIASAWHWGETVAVAPDPYGGYYDSWELMPHTRCGCGGSRLAAVAGPAALLVYVRCRCAAHHPRLALRPLRGLHLPLLPDGQFPPCGPAALALLDGGERRRCVQFLIPVDGCRAASGDVPMRPHSDAGLRPSLQPDRRSIHPAAGVAAVRAAPPRSRVRSVR